MCYSPHLPCPHRVQHCVFIRWQREEDCLGDLESVPRGDWCLWRTLTHASDVSEESKSLLERFVVLMYDRAGDIMEMNDASKQLFAQKSRALDNIPPTQAALQQHTKRASPQANCWNQTLVLNPELASPSDWGWTKEASAWQPLWTKEASAWQPLWTKEASAWQPLWTTLPEASKSCHELIHCNRKKACTGRWKCTKAACSGDC